jgi:hypothetical protein
MQAQGSANLKFASPCAPAVIRRPKLSPPKGAVEIDNLIVAPTVTFGVL